MPKESFVSLRFPIKGITENTAFEAVPKGYTARALNVRGFDALAGKLRGGQRPGTAKYISSQVDGTNAIQALEQATIASAPGPATLASDDFTYSDGFLGDQADWTCFNVTVDIFAGTISFNSDSADPQVVSNQAEVQDSGNHFAEHSTTPGGTSYTLKCDIKAYSPDGVGTSATNRGGLLLGKTTSPDNAWYRLQVVMNDTSAGGGVALRLEGQIGDDSESINLDNNLIPLVDSSETEQFELKAVVGGNTVDVYINGSLQDSGTFTLTPSLEDCDKVGIYGHTSGAASTAAEIDNWALIGSGGGSLSYREQYLIAVSGGNVYRSDSPPTTLTQATSGSGAVADDVVRVGAQAGPPSPSDSSPLNAHRFVYLADGSAYTRLDVNDNSIVSWTAASGSLPTDSNGDTCRIIALYRNRIVLSGLPNDPQNWFMSAVADPRDWNYSPSTPSATQAVAGNNTDAGEVGDRVTALIPVHDDLLIMGGDASLWQMTGDPAAGGSIDNLSRDVGIVGPDAWAIDPFGMIYFFGPNGLYAMTTGGNIALVSEGLLDEEFQDVDLRDTRVVLEWDRARHGLHVCFVKDAEPSSSTTHYFFDGRAEAFWPEEYPTSNGPTAMLNFDGDKPEDRTLILGGWDSYLRYLEDTRKDDDDGASDATINSYVDIGPIRRGAKPVRLTMTEFNVVLANGSDGCDAKVFNGRTAEEAWKATSPQYKVTIGSGRHQAIKRRVTGNTLIARLQNDTASESWAFEEASAAFKPTGRTRQPGG